ncbi:MAG: hypothetical protein CMO81_01940 [Waddliaceae bacterium]|nr:hypothetical protein [Waddliaceae bacterium]
MCNFKLISKLMLVTVALISLAGCQAYVPDLAGTRAENSAEDLEKIYNGVSVPDHPITLDEIIQLSLHQNLEIRMQQQELAIQHEIKTAEKLKMLPSLTVNGELSYRDKSTASVSESAIDGTPASIASISTDQTQKKYDITAAWSILDFGLSYYRHRREQNRTLLLKLQHQRLQQNLVFDIVRAYWRTIVARKAAEGAELLIELAAQTQVDLRRQIERKIVSEIEGLTNENRLIDMQIKLAIFKNEYNSAKSELAQFMGLSRDSEFELAAAELLPVGQIAVGLGELELEAVQNRPELFAQDVEEQIQLDDVKATLLRMFPNLNLFGALNGNGDSHLVNSNWLSVGAKTTWNLLSIPSILKEKNAIEERAELVRRTRLQESVAVLTQVHLAFINHLDTVEQYRLAKDLYAVKTRLLEAAKKEQAQGVFHGADILEFEVETLFAKINTLKAYAELQVGLERLGNSVGIPLKYLREGGDIATLGEVPTYTSTIAGADDIHSTEDLWKRLIKGSSLAFKQSGDASVITSPEWNVGSDKSSVALFYRRETIQMMEEAQAA